MNEENELEQIRLKKIKAMLDTTAKGQNTVQQTANNLK